MNFIHINILYNNENLFWIIYFKSSKKDGCGKFNCIRDFDYEIITEFGYSDWVKRKILFFYLNI